MRVLPLTQAVLLLTAYFSNPKEGDLTPLSPKEWGRFAQWLKDRSLNPELLMTGNPGKLLEGWNDKDIPLERIEQLMNRGAALALAMEKWSRAGLWVLTRSDEDYPIRLKQRLKTDSPAVLFGCGNANLLNGGGIAVVGSRNAKDEDINFSYELGALVAQDGYSIVSGGARGVDEASMMGALEAEGTVIGVLSDNLLRATTSKKYRRYLLNKNLVLVSPFNPEAGFSVGNAMARNKHIYCLSDAAVVVHSGTKGGTWSGAMENLRKSRVPMWVKETGDMNSGNAHIVEKGAKWLTSKLVDFKVSELIDSIEEAAMPQRPKDLFSELDKVQTSQVSSQLDQKSEESHIKVDLKSTEKSDEIESKNMQIDEISVVERADFIGMSFYELFLLKIQELAATEAKSVDELVEDFKVSKTQLNKWLKQAVKDKKVKKLSKPVRYQFPKQCINQTKMFDD